MIDHVTQALFACLICALIFAMIAIGAYISASRGRNMTKNPKGGRSDQYFTPDPSIRPFIKDRPRHYAIFNMQAHQTCRTQGYTFPEALETLGWLEKDVRAVDFGPSGPLKSITPYVPIGPSPDDQIPPSPEVKEE